MAANQLHESVEDLGPETREMHRALISLIEELEAVDWYGQRLDASNDEELRQVLAHNCDEEKEHACMTLEWIRRHDPSFSDYLRKFLFRSQSAPIVNTNSEAEQSRANRTLKIGSLREEGARA